MSATILIIEDEEDLLELLEYNLQKEGYDTVGFLSTKGVDRFLSEEKVDLFIVDRNLPNVEGSEYIEELRKKGNQSPVIFLSAKDSDKNIEEGFLRGGDDYMTKPFNIKELLYRIKAILKRSSDVKRSNVLYHRDMELDIKERIFFIEGKKIELTKLEFDLIFVFMSNKNIVLKRDFLLQEIWQDTDVFQDKTVNVAVNRLKRKIDPKNEKKYIISIWGVGYKLC